MDALTGLTGFDWVLVQLYLLGAVLVLEGLRREPAGTRLARLLVVPALAGVALAVVAALAYPHETGHLLLRIGDRAAGLAVAVAVLLAAVAFGDLLLTRLTPIAGSVLRRLPIPARVRGDLALLLGVGVPVAIALAAMPRVSSHLESGLEREQAVVVTAVTVRATYDLPGHPMDLELRSPTGGYVSFGEGTVARFELPSGLGGRVRVTTVAKGLRYPRGIAVLGDTLYVAELGPLPCPHPFPTCKGGDVEGVSVEATERRILHESRARVLAFDIRADGSLGTPRTVVSGLPFGNSDHGVNDVVAGPDGRLYLSIGNLDRLYATPGLGPDLRRPHADLLGTVVSFRPDGGDLRAFATGLRNVYGLAFDREGRLYGADNDGFTRAGWKREEVLEIARAASYGYPAEGTFGPYTTPRSPPLWVLDTVGSGGIAWLSGGAPGGRLVVGSCGAVDVVRLGEGRGGAPLVADRTDVTRLVELPGCATSVTPVRGGLAVGVFTFGGSSKLYLLGLAD